MKAIAKCYPQEGMEPSALIKRIKEAELDGIAISAISGTKANFQTAKMPFSGCNLGILKELMNEENLELGLILPFFHDDFIWQNYPEERADINDPSQTWYRPLCPVFPGLFRERLSLFKEAVAEINPDFVGLDFLRFPLFWEGLDEKMELRSCSCKECPADGKRPEIIASMAKEAKKEFDSLKVAIHLVPFIGRDVIEVTGQDPEILIDAVDILSPMLYHRLLKREERFVLSVLDELPPFRVWPSVEMSSSFRENPGLLKNHEKIIYFHLDLL
ncbi:MAG: hypothetical protein PHD88_04515 [Firmicutes bacterium]|nr:hypothetical protein [Bacillota bacterium]MDD4264032.1 hypothetical protein [Bacillota bacterium]MDD4693655.1 hypothetical protein [Bacillota bacterium]